jgi:exonuclease SbcD
MKFLHTSDLHIDKMWGNMKLIGEQRKILKQIIDIAVDKKCDAVIIAGDVYDKRIPSADAMTVFDEFISCLYEKNLQAYIISGNHDSNERVAYLSGMIENRGIHICGNFSGHTEVIRTKDEYGELFIHMLPFIKPSDVRKFYPKNKIVTYDDAVRIVMENSEFDESARNIIISHQFVTGSKTCDSEVFAVGGLDNISAEIYSGFDYAALGHIHTPQHVFSENIRYSGSPLKYSFSEVSHKKSVVIVEMLEKGNIKTEKAELIPDRDVRDLTGTIEELENMPYTTDYVRVTVTDEDVPPDTRINLQEHNFPYMLKFIVKNSKNAYNVTTAEDTDTVEHMTPEELFIAFYRSMNNDVMPSDEHIAVMREIIEEVEDRRK